MTPRFFKTLRPLVPAAAAAALALLFFHPVLFGGKTFFFRDFHRYFYPMKHTLAAAYADGNLPFWDPHNFCGEPFFSNIQTGVLYPPSALLALFPFPLSLNLYVVFHILLGVFFFHRFVTSLGCSRGAALITGISYGFGSCTVASINLLTSLSTLIWLPAVLWSYRAGTEGGRPRALFGTALFLSMAILAGEPQLFLMFAALLLLFALTRGGPGPQAERRRLGAALTVAVLVVTALAVTAVQLGPMYVDYLNSVRLKGVPYEAATSFSMSWGMLRHLFTPLNFPPDFGAWPGVMEDFFPGDGDVPWLLTVYPGFVVTPLALLGLVLAPGKDRFVWAGAFLAGLLLALGRHTPLYQAFYFLLPFFRYPEKFLFPASFCLLIVAAHGVDAVLARLARLGVSPKRMAVVLAVVLGADLYLAHGQMNPTVDAAFYRYRHPGLNALFASRERSRVYVDRDMTLPPRAARTVRATHIFWQLFLAPNLGAVAGVSQAGGESGVELNYQYVVTEILSRPWKERIGFLRAANVRYVVSTEPLDGLPELDGRLTRVSGQLFRLDDTLPRAWLTGELQPSTGAFSASRAVAALDRERPALTRKTVADRYRDPFFQPVAEVTYESDGTVTLAAHTDRPAVLVLAEAFYPGWRVWVDGREKTCLNINYLFQGVELEPGSHRVRFVYRPRHFTAFLWVSGVSLLLFAAAWAACRGRREKTVGALSPESGRGEGEP